MKKRGSDERERRPNLAGKGEKGRVGMVPRRRGRDCTGVKVSGLYTAVRLYTESTEYRVYLRVRSTTQSQGTPASTM